jgi:hypothetical protein
MRATEAGSHRASGHRIENAPLSEYQRFQSNVVNTRRCRPDGPRHLSGARSLIEESILGWKKVELEVMRDHKDNVVIICSNRKLRLD